MNMIQKILFLTFFSAFIVGCPSDPSTASCGTVGAPVCFVGSSVANVTVTAGDAQVSISWDSMAGTVSYNLYMATVSGVDSTNYSQLSGGARQLNVTSPYTLTGLTNGTTYYFVITAVDSNGDETIASAEVSATPGVQTAPNAPTGVIALSSDSSVNISWGSSSTATSYNVYMAEVSGVNASNYSSLTGGMAHLNVTSSFTHNGLVNGTTYYFVVTAVNASGESVTSLEVSGTPASVPAQVQNVTTTAGNGQVTLDWTVVTGATSYNYYYGPNSGITPANYASIGGSFTNTSAGPINISGLTNGTPYYFIVTAINVNGEGLASTEVTTTPVAIPAQVTNVQIFPTDGAITLSWDTVLGATSYNYYYGSTSGITPANYASLGATFTNTSGGPVTVPGLTNGVTYYFIVTAVNALAEGVSSTEVAVTPSSEWAGAAPLLSNRSRFVGVALNGRIHTIGGYTDGPVTNSHEVYDPINQVWSTDSAMFTARAGAAEAVINGKIHVISGAGLAGVTAVHEVFDPVNHSWSSAASIPTARFAVSSAVLNGKIHVIAGQASGNSVKHEVYDPIYDTWSIAADIPVAMSYATSAVISGKIHVIGGTAGTAHYVYDPVSNIWTTAAAMPTNRGELASSVVLDGKIHVIGGVSGSVLNTHEIYDPELDQWSVATPLPTARYAASNVLLNGEIHVIGGSDSTNYVATHEVYTPATLARSWSTNSAMLSVRNGMGSAELNGKIYSIGGLDTSGGRSTLVESFDTTFGWQALAPLPTPNYYLSATSLNGDVYAIGGMYAGGETSDVYRYDVDLNTWSVATSLPTPLRNHSAAALNGKIYVAGGYDGVNTLSNVHVFDPSTAMWTSGVAMNSGRSYATLNEVNGKLYAIGGWNGVVNLTTVEEFDPQTGMWQTRSSMPTTINSHTSVVKNGKIYIIGGALSVNNVWEYNPTNDTWLALDAMPNGLRELGAGVINGDIHVFGGSDSAGITASHFTY